MRLARWLAVAAGVLVVGAVALVVAGLTLVNPRRFEPESAYGLD